MERLVTIMIAFAAVMMLAGAGPPEKCADTDCNHAAAYENATATTIDKPTYDVTEDANTETTLLMLRDEKNATPDGGRLFMRNTTPDEKVAIACILNAPTGSDPICGATNARNGPMSNTLALKIWRNREVTADANEGVGTGILVEI